jgi:hypothetical protein
MAEWKEAVRMADSRNMAIVGTRADLGGGQQAADPVPYRPSICRQPRVEGLTVTINSQFNGWRMEDVRLDK